MTSPERWRTGPRYRAVTAITIALLPVAQILLATTSTTTALLLLSQQSTSTPWFLACLLLLLAPSFTSLLTDGVPVLLQPVGLPPLRPLCLLLLLHSLHISGLVLLLFFALPTLNMLQSYSLLGCLASAPALLRLLRLQSKSDPLKTKLMDALCSLIQLSGLITWPLVFDSQFTWTIPLGLFLTSFGFCLHPLASLGQDQFDLMKEMNSWTGLQRKFFNTSSAIISILISSLSLLSASSTFSSFQASDTGLPVLLLTLQLCSSFLMRWVAVMSSHSKLELPGIILPLTLSPLVTLLPICLFTVGCSNLPDLLGVHLHCSTSPSTLEMAVLPCVFAATHAALCWILRRQPNPLNRMPTMYSTFLSTSVLLHNLQPQEDKKTPEGRPTVIGCATMWHETAEEMRALLTSVFNVDRDQALPDNSANFKWELHVLFDDAINCNDATGEIVPNQFLQTFCDEMSTLLAAYSNSSTVTAEDVTITKTPYGGLLEWTLPGGSKLLCHLKEKAVIRNKKRWSQCMYFLYFLGHPRLPTSPYVMEQPMNNTFILALDGDVEFSYTGVLRLVEVGFKTCLMVSSIFKFQVMHDHPKTGGVCAQMQPKRSKHSLQIYLQIFEYLTGHMMFKATEHVMGNVRCAPGCFSLFRASALHENISTNQDLPSVIEMYSSVTKRYLNHISNFNEILFRGHECLVYDLGEDLWLCMMIIQRGWRIRYCALSDVFTQCPEELEEFLKQRRRWTVSGTVNLLRVLYYCRDYLRHNGFNLVHILYQLNVAFFAIMIGPAVMFTMLLYGLSTITGLEPYIGAILMSLPTVALALAIVFCSHKIQTKAVLISSGFYAIFFIVAFLYELISGFLDGCYTSPIVITYGVVVASYLVLTILHPRQIPDFFYGISYPFTLPFMFLILPLYCLLNMDDVSWGTREVKKTHQSIKKAEAGEVTDARLNWTLDTFEKPVKMASKEEEHFWNRTIEEFLKPTKLTEEQENIMKQDLKFMKRVSIIVLFTTNIGFSLAMVLKQAFPFPSKLAIDIVFCGTHEPVDFVDLTLFCFVSIVILFLLVGTIVHRAETLSHIVRTTSLSRTEEPPSVTTYRNVTDYDNPALESA